MNGVLTTHMLSSMYESRLLRQFTQKSSEQTYYFYFLLENNILDKCFLNCVFIFLPHLHMVAIVNVSFAPCEICVNRYWLSVENNLHFYSSFGWTTIFGLVVSALDFALSPSFGAMSVNAYTNNAQKWERNTKQKL